MRARQVAPAVLGKLFDEIDTDKSGYLDLKEAKAALKKWQATAARLSAPPPHPSSLPSSPLPSSPTFPR